jgi:hypothetical protein
MALGLATLLNVTQTTFGHSAPVMLGGSAG